MELWCHYSLLRCIFHWIPSTSLISVFFTMYLDLHVLFPLDIFGKAQRRQGVQFPFPSTELAWEVSLNCGEKLLVCCHLNWQSKSGVSEVFLKSSRLQSRLKATWVISAQLYHTVGKQSFRQLGLGVSGFPNTSPRGVGGVYSLLTPVNDESNVYTLTNAIQRSFYYIFPWRYSLSSHSVDKVWPY